MTEAFHEENIYKNLETRYHIRTCIDSVFATCGQIPTEYLVQSASLTVAMVLQRPFEAHRGGEHGGASSDTGLLSSALHLPRLPTPTRGPCEQ